MTIKYLEQNQIQSKRSYTNQKKNVNNISLKILQKKQVKVQDQFTRKKD